MYQVIQHKYGAPTPEGVTYTTTEQVTEYLAQVDMKALVYLEIRYVRRLTKTNQ